MKRRTQTRRIYYGPPGKEKAKWWTVKVRPAIKPVTLRGSAVHALHATAGVTVGCAFSDCVACVRTNREAFPHPVFIASFTKSTATIVDRLRKNGEPMTAVVYKHNYGHITDKNDDGTLKKLVRENPSVMEREFTLNPPRNRTKDKWRSGTNIGRESATGMVKKTSETFIPRGALKRAVKAGLIPTPVARQIIATTE